MIGYTKGENEKEEGTTITIKNEILHKKRKQYEGKREIKKRKQKQWQDLRREKVRRRLGEKKDILR